MTFDAVASRIHGAVKGRNVRVVWQDGRLYVAKTPTDVVVVTSQAPQKTGGSFKASTLDGDVTIQVPHCGSCRRRIETSAVGQMPLADILAFGTADV